MKTEVSEVNKCSHSPRPEILDEFWNDCIEIKSKQSGINYKENNQNNQNQNLKDINNNRYENTKINNPNTNTNQNSKIITYFNSKLYSPNNKLFNINSTKNNDKINILTEKILENICLKHPSYLEEMKEEEYKKIKSKNALIRCLGLYSYGLELKKTLKKNKENCDKLRMENDLSKCTFKPKLNKKISYLDKKDHVKVIDRLYRNNQKKILNKSVDNINKNKDFYENKNNHLKNIKDEYYKECTFKPKFESDPKAMQKMFKKRMKFKRPSIEKINAEFILRYTKARDEYLIKRFKKLDRKDDSYDNSLLSLTKRLCNKEYKNYLNVNNTINLFGETLTPNNYLHSLNSSIADFRGLSIYNEVSETKKNKKKAIVGLRNNLRNLDLSDNDE